MTSRPTVSVYDVAQKTITKEVAMPDVFQAPIRLDIVHFVHSNLAKNRRQAHGVNPKAGMKHSAESWGTGRAVARIPRVSGSGTHRSGQAAFGNQCRKGRMFAPLKTWRRWHRRVNIKHKRHAVASAIAASGIAPLVQGRGHKIENIPQMPLVFDDKIEQYEKTKQVVSLLKNVGAYADVKKVIDSKKTKCGKGKLRNKRFYQRKGPLFIYYNDNVKLVQAVRNIPGVDICNVNRLNILQLAPGGQLGRFIIWTQSAFEALNRIFGTMRYASLEKQNYQLIRPMMTNADLAKIINSNEIQSVVRDKKEGVPMHTSQKKNPLVSRTALYKLNPHAKLVQEAAKKAQEDAKKRRQETIEKKRAGLSKDAKKDLKKRKQQSKEWFKLFEKRIQGANEAAIQEEIDFKNINKDEEEDNEEYEIVEQ